MWPAKKSENAMYLKTVCVYLNTHAALDQREVWGYCTGPEGGMGILHWTRGRYGDTALDQREVWGYCTGPEGGMGILHWTRGRYGDAIYNQTYQYRHLHYCIILCLVQMLWQLFLECNASYVHHIVKSLGDEVEYWAQRFSQTNYKYRSWSIHPFSLMP